MKNLIMKYMAILSNTYLYYSKTTLAIKFFKAALMLMLLFINGCSSMPIKQVPQSETIQNTTQDQKLINEIKALQQAIDRLKSEKSADQDINQIDDQIPPAAENIQRQVNKLENRLLALNRRLNQQTINQQTDEFKLNLENSDQALTDQNQTSLYNNNLIIDSAQQDNLVSLDTLNENKEQNTITLSELLDKYQDQDLIPPAQPKELEKLPGAQIEYTRAYGLYLKGDYTNAVRALSGFLAKFNNDYYTHNAYYWLGMSYFNLNILNLAEIQFRKVLTGFEHSNESQGYKTADAIYMLGRLSEKQNEEAKSIYYYLKVVEKFPKSAIAENARTKIRQKIRIE